jgi:ubiquinone/menaquinone biosynthesis C-methylase UbiE
MKRACLDILCCPLCKTPFRIEGEGTNTEQIMEGELLCQGCGKRFPIVNGIVRFIKREEFGEADRKHENFRRYFYSYIYDLFTKFEFTFCGGEKKARHDCLERLEIRPGSRILETGIGTGSNLPYLKESLGDGCFFGIDISSSMLRKCRKNLKKWGCPAEIFLARAENLPFKNGSFDTVFHLGAINLFENKQQAIEEMIRVARPGTKVVIADENEEADKLRDKLLIPRLVFGKREEVVPPIDMVPKTMTDIRLNTIWNGLGYCIDFRTPVY